MHGVGWQVRTEGVDLTAQLVLRSPLTHIEESLQKIERARGCYDEQDFTELVEAMKADGTWFL